MASVHEVVSRSRPQVNKIAVLTDFSHNADTALRFAATFGRRYKSEIVIAHAYLPPACAYAAPEISLLYRTLDGCRERMVHRLDTMLEAPYLDGIRCSALLLQGSPDELLEELQDADLIVAGTSGATGPSKTASGSTTGTIFRSSGVPVITVGSKCCYAAETTRFNTILYATDFSAASQIALPYAVSIANEHGAQLVLLHVAQNKGVPFYFDRALAKAEPLEKLRQLARVGIDLKRQPQYVVSWGVAAAAIIAEAKRVKADLIVVGARRAGALVSVISHFNAGTAYRVAADATCPVLTIDQT